MFIFFFHAPRELHKEIILAARDIIYIFVLIFGIIFGLNYDIFELDCVTFLNFFLNFPIFFIISLVFVTQLVFAQLLTFLVEPVVWWGRQWGSERPVFERQLRLLHVELLSVLNKDEPWPLVLLVVACDRI